ncbi:hypothetical protein [Halodesulfovibrio sp.]|jgi:hypothetical protein|uniref:hypothetical protein n=1 Tax=Halodesulfovibrio sp. TaxID=1912772 RepID=UPI0025E0DF93|nr:hypothetical protein [Halodesulfovibrio sp.]MCT4626673.1 hypothetical protein [Halodesulfovibrio sp.]
MIHITSTITAFFISLLLLISSTTQAHAEILLPVSCDNVTKISVGQLKASDLGITIEGNPFLYFVAIYLTAGAAAKYNELASYSIILDVRPDGTFIIGNPLIISTPSGSLTSDLPYQNSINSRQLILFVKTKKRTLEAAEMICPRIIPTYHFLYDYLNKQRQKNRKTDNYEIKKGGY